jgi:hypothetical protein
MQPASSLTPAEHFHYLPLERVVRANDRYLFRITIEMVVVGIMTCLPST